MSMYGSNFSNRLHYIRCPFHGQAIFLERVEILSVTTKSKKIEVSGGFYSEEDMKTELGYKENFGCTFLYYITLSGVGVWNYSPIANPRSKSFLIDLTKGTHREDQKVGPRQETCQAGWNTTASKTIWLSPLD